MEPILTLRNVGFRYGEIQALKEINLQVRPGEILGILGPNGSGKSTLLKIMDGILRPQEGEILIKGKPLDRLKRTHVAKEIAMVSQENFFRFSFSTLEVVLMGRFPHLKRLQFEGKRDMEVALDALRATHTLELAERSIHELSGGERQRVYIARALAQEPKIILLDEPTSFLDIAHQVQVLELIVRLNRELGLTVLMVLHDLNLASEYCTRMILLNNGSIAKKGSPEEVITYQNIEEVYKTVVVVKENPLSGRPCVFLVTEEEMEKAGKGSTL
jgi:iron complex transport system ATP-binding protein